MNNINWIRFIVLNTFLSLTVGIYGQSLLIVEPVEFLPTQIYASRNPRQDAKGKFCGVLMIHSAIKNLKFQGCVGDINYENGIYYVYLPAGMKKLNISDGYGNNLSIKLPVIAPKSTYQATIARTIEKGNLICKSDPSGAMVTLHSSDEDINLGQTPILGNVEIKEGTYTITLSKANFQTQKIKNVKIKKDKVTDLGTIKLKK